MTNQDFIKKLNVFFEKHPDELGQKNTLEDILFIEEKLNLKLNDLYKEIICNFGSCFLGLPIHSLKVNKSIGNETIIMLTNWFRDYASKNNLPNEYLDYIAFSHDGMGNYILISNNSNELFIYYHDEGVIESFYNEKLDKLILNYINEE